MLVPGCFESSLRSPLIDITAVVDHNDSKVLGSLSRGNLRLSEDSQGLRFELELARDKLGHNTLARLARGELDYMSFQTAVYDSEYYYSQGVKIRAVFGARLIHIALLEENPAYPESYAILGNGQAAAAELAGILKTRHSNRRRRLELEERR